MRYLFRVDANATMGVGHLMRCLALARALQALGAECIFLCRGEGLGRLAQDITNQGHWLLSLPQTPADGVQVDGLAHSHWLPGGWQQDVQACRGVLQGVPAADWLVVDHYALDQRWEHSMRSASKRLMVIDDLADRRHDCDVLLDQSLVDAMSTRYEGLVPAHCQCLLGPRYALLRNEFASLSPTGESQVRADAARVLVMFGGADAANLTLRAVRALARLQWHGRVDVVAGPLYAHLTELRAAVAGLPDGVLHAPALHIAELMLQADLAVGSPGVTSWERCACGLPALTIAQAGNQEPIAQALAKEGVHWYLGRAEQVDDEMLDASLTMLLNHRWTRESLHRNARRICDGRGVTRVLGVLESGAGFTVRRARAEDGIMLHAWRNDARTRRYFRDPSPLALSEHLQWFEAKLVDPASLLLIASKEGAPAGCIRFDLDGERAEVSIYLDPSLHGNGQGMGSAALRAAMAWIFEMHSEVLRIDAEVHADNVASAKMFLNCDYVPTWSRFEFRRPVQ